MTKLDIEPSKWALGDNTSYTPSEQPDIVITDPPYSCETHQSQLTQSATYKDGKWHMLKAASRVDVPFDAISSVDYVQVLQTCLVAKRWVIIFTDLSQLYPLYYAAGNWAVKAGIYRKTRSVPGLSGTVPGGCGCEGILICHNPGTKKRWHGKGRRAFFEACPADRKRTGHPTAKPIALVEELLGLFTDPGELVYDPYGGTASIGVACLRMGRRYEGVEISETYYNKGIERLANFNGKLARV